MTFNELRKRYKTFTYNSFDIKEEKELLKITFNFEIEGLSKFNPTTIINKEYINNKNINKNYMEYLIFHIGLIEMISYYKCCCPKNIIIKAGYLNNNQINFFKKLIYLGLGEFLYTNNININENDLVNISVIHDNNKITIPEYNSFGNLILLGGGKDSNVSLELLRDMENDIFIQNPKQVMLDCAKVAGYNESKIVTINRTIDKRLIHLNNLGYLNGHTPFSSLIAFETYLVAYLMNKKYIVLSNEESANESTVLGTKINHQYSKSFEFEQDFNNYTKDYFQLDIHYFSFLRPLTEYQIAMLFSSYKKYHHIFRSCNKGSKKIPWEWCGNCSKCLFVYIILSPFLYKDELIKIFNKDLYDDVELLSIFKELIGETGVKPFDCVGSIKEAKYAISKIILKLQKENKKLPYLLKYYNNNYIIDITEKYETKFNDINNVPNEFIKRIKEELKKYD